MAYESLTAGQSPRQSSYEVITSAIIRKLEQGVIPWRRPWNTQLPTNLKSQKAYRGINTILLACQGYASPYWVTFNQVRSIGGHVRKGEHGTPIAFWKFDEYETLNADGENEKHSRFLLRHYTVFNVLQCDGLPDFGVGKRASNPIERIGDCERILVNMPNPPTIEASNSAWYRPSTDTVGIPPVSTFNNAEGYYSTLFHEMTHSTGHASRVGREGIETLNAFDSESYSKEELIAELGAAMLCGQTGIEQATLDNSASYIACWLKRLRDDSRLVVSAASHAQSAADYILDKTVKSETEVQA